MDITYNRAEAVNYARTWAFRRNPRYMDFSKLGGDCTNFICQCVVAGGMPMNYSNPFGWFYKSPKLRSASFSGVEYLYQFLMRPKQGRGPVAVETPIESLEVGDIIQLSFDGTKFGHSLLVVQSGSDPKIATHSMDSLDRPLSSYIYAKARGLHITGAYK